MSEEVGKYDGHRFNDIFYAYSELFTKRCFTNLSWSEDLQDFEQKAALPIDIVRPYVNRLLKEHGSDQLLHTIIAANFECNPMAFNKECFSFVQDFKFPFKKHRKSVLISAFGLDEQCTNNCVFKCPRCEFSSYLVGPGPKNDLYKALRQHSGHCEMSTNDIYLKPLKEFWLEDDQEEYLNFLHKAVAQTVLMKLGLLIVRPKLFDKMPFSEFNRRLSLRLVLSSRKRPLFNDDALNKMVEAGYHTSPYAKAMGLRELKKTSRVSTRHPNADSKIKCFCCHHVVALSADFVSDPWRYHAKMSPSCTYLLMKKGMDYVNQVQKSVYDFRPRNIEPFETTPKREFFDMCKGITGRKKTELLVALSATTVPLCTMCLSESRTVAFMPCLHIATCVDCSFAISVCPLCRECIKGVMMPIFQPDGSFWKQPDCVGGHYFMNMPCCHLIESCVPNSHDDPCPKAHAIKEDKIYCAVCGKMNLGKLKVYL